MSDCRATFSVIMQEYGTVIIFVEGGRGVDVKRPVEPRGEGRRERDGWM